MKVLVKPQQRTPCDAQWVLSKHEGPLFSLPTSLRVVLASLSSRPLQVTPHWWFFLNDKPNEDFVRVKGEIHLTCLFITLSIYFLILACVLWTFPIFLCFIYGVDRSDLGQTTGWIHREDMHGGLLSTLSWLVMAKPCCYFCQCALSIRHNPALGYMFMYIIT